MTIFLNSVNATYKPNSFFTISLSTNNSCSSIGSTPKQKQGFTLRVMSNFKLQTYYLYVQIM